MRPIIKGTIWIRHASLKVRMPQAPETFISDMNKLSMAMAAQRPSAQSKTNRKASLRKMKRLAQRVQSHAQAHRDALTPRRAETSLSAGQANVIIQRLESLLAQLPAAIKQAHERIIGERQGANEDKILSLYGARKLDV